MIILIRQNHSDQEIKLTLIFWWLSTWSCLPEKWKVARCVFHHYQNRYQRHHSFPFGSLSWSLTQWKSIQLIIITITNNIIIIDIINCQIYICQYHEARGKVLDLKYLKDSHKSFQKSTWYLGSLFIITKQIFKTGKDLFAFPEVKASFLVNITTPTVTMALGVVSFFKRIWDYSGLLMVLFIFKSMNCHNLWTQKWSKYCNNKKHPPEYCKTFKLTNK